MKAIKRMPQLARRSLVAACMVVTALSLVACTAAYAEPSGTGASYASPIPSYHSSSPLVGDYKVVSGAKNGQALTGSAVPVGSITIAGYKFKDSFTLTFHQCARGYGDYKLSGSTLIPLDGVFSTANGCVSFPGYDWSREFSQGSITVSGQADSALTLTAGDVKLTLNKLPTK